MVVQFNQTLAKKKIKYFGSDLKCLQRNAASRMFTQKNLTWKFVSSDNKFVGLFSWSSMKCSCNITTMESAPEALVSLHCPLWLQKVESFGNFLQKKEYKGF